MSKGHAPRQGRDDKAFSAGYDCIDWGRKEEPKPITDHEGRPMTYWGGKPNEPDAQKHVRDIVAASIEGDEYAIDLFWYALNYRTAHPMDADRCWGELQDCVNRLVAKQDKTCQHCKHWLQSRSHERHHCSNDSVRDMIESYEFAFFESTPNFSCNRWEAKV